ncbi:hypothetical protein O3P69_018973 [Scylla paramamosain]|uniref:Uncharacterized protein n=1 Tax=Scylla paramamosain TaxID=85552 RepID=A0AAW0S9L9_SCYPA
MTPTDHPIACPFTSGTQACQVFEDLSASSARNGVTSCRPFREVLPEAQLQFRLATTCQHFDLAGAITDAFEQRSPLAWWRLLSFPYKNLLAKTADPSSPQETDFRISSETSSLMRFSVVEDDVLAAIKATPLGSAAGLNGVRLLHLSQLFGGRTAEAGHRLLNALTELCNSTIAGNIPEHTREAFTAIKKKNGGVRPIAVGSIYRRLVSNLLSTWNTSGPFISALTLYFATLQLL